MRREFCTKELDMALFSVFYSALVLVLASLPDLAVAEDVITPVATCRLAERDNASSVFQIGSMLRSGVGDSFTHWVIVPGRDTGKGHSVEPLEIVYRSKRGEKYRARGGSIELALIGKTIGATPNGNSQYIGDLTYKLWRIQ